MGSEAPGPSIIAARPGIFASQVLAAAPIDDGRDM
jgi:hypothetical protein